MKYSLALTLLALAGCNHPSASPLMGSPNSPRVEAVSIPATDATTRTRPVEVSQQRADELYSLLQKLGVKPVAVEKTTYLTFYDLACHLENPAEIARCEFFTEPPERKGRKEHVVKGKKEFDTLRLLLSEYPVEQGEPGAVARFVQCRKYSYTPTTDCYLAVQVNYEGP